jgi:hypothetical protein
VNIACFGIIADLAGYRVLLPRTAMDALPPTTQAASCSASDADAIDVVPDGDAVKVTTEVIEEERLN